MKLQTHTSKLGRFQVASPPPRQNQVDSSSGLTLDPQDSFVASSRSKEQSASDFWRNSGLVFGAALSTFSALTGGTAHAGVVSTVGVEAVESTQQANELNKPGLLVLSDYFDSRAGSGHGTIVEDSARDIGFSGNIVKREAPENEAVKSAHRFFSRLDNRTFSPSEMRQFTSDYILNRQVGSLQSAKAEIDSLGEVHNSVLNLSRGFGKAQIMDELYTRLRMAWDVTAHPQSQTAGQRRLQKLAPALDMDPEAILQGSQGQRAEFQKRLLALIDEASSDARLADAQAQYDHSVTGFESRKNSVVVAAANSGEILETMRADAPTPVLAKDFFRNLLANDEVTTVGATRGTGASEQVAAYTNPDSGIDIYADGDTGPAWGTSFATPRVGAVMARLHGDFPEASSEEVEAMIASKFGYMLEDYGKAPVAPALNEAAAQEWLVANSSVLARP